MPERKKAVKAEGAVEAVTKKASTRKGAAKKAGGEAVAGQLRVKQIRSGIGHAETYRRTLVALGLKHHQDEVVVRDVPSVRGMLRKVWNLVSVRAVEG
jgi:large subunit ribosomal protein L30